MSDRLFTAPETIPGQLAMATDPLTSSQRRQIVNAEYRKALANITPNMGAHYSGQQIAAAKGITRKRALAIIDQDS